MIDKAQAIPGLAGEVALVWGGGAGIGLATAERLARSGCRLATIDLDGQLAERAAASLRAIGAEAIGIQADVTIEAHVDAALDQAASALGTPRLSACVVGRATAFKPLLDMTPADWEHDQALNLQPMFLIGCAIARRLVAEQLTGSLAFVSSVSGLQAAHHHASYGAAKRGMMSLAETMANEWGRHGIRVNTVAPGVTHTQRVTPSEPMMELMMQRVPAGRFANIDEIANCIAFLLSDLASYVSGHTLVADGGWMTVPAIIPDQNPTLAKS